MSERRTFIYLPIHTIRMYSIKTFRHTKRNQSCQNEIYKIPPAPLNRDIYTHSFFRICWEIGFGVIHLKGKKKVRNSMCWNMSTNLVRSFAYSFYIKVYKPFGCIFLMQLIRFG